MAYVHISPFTIVNIVKDEHEEIPKEINFFVFSKIDKDLDEKFGGKTFELNWEKDETILCKGEGIIREFIREYLSKKLSDLVNDIIEIANNDSVEKMIYDLVAMSYVKDLFQVFLMAGADRVALKFVSSKDEFVKLYEEAKKEYESSPQSYMAIYDNKENLELSGSGIAHAIKVGIAVFNAIRAKKDSKLAIDEERAKRLSDIIDRKIKELNYHNDAIIGRLTDSKEARELYEKYAEMFGTDSPIINKEYKIPVDEMLGRIFTLTMALILNDYMSEDLKVNIGEDEETGRIILSLFAGTVQEGAGPNYIV